jgi:hypothetical protein
MILWYYRNIIPVRAKRTKRPSAKKTRVKIKTSYCIYCGQSFFLPRAFSSAVRQTSFTNCETSSLRTHNLRGSVVISFFLFLFFLFFLFSFFSARPSPEQIFTNCEYLLENVVFFKSLILRRYTNPYEFVEN